MHKYVRREKKSAPDLTKSSFERGQRKTYQLTDRKIQLTLALTETYSWLDATNRSSQFVFSQQQNFSPLTLKQELLVKPLSPSLGVNVLLFYTRRKYLSYPTKQFSSVLFSEFQIYRRRCPPVTFLCEERRT